MDRVADHAANAVSDARVKVQPGGSPIVDSGSPVAAASFEEGLHKESLSQSSVSARLPPNQLRV